MKGIKSLLEKRLHPTDLERVKILYKCGRSLKSTWKQERKSLLSVNTVRDTIRSMGITQGDTILVHSSISHMYVNPKQWASKEPNNIVMYALKIIDMLIDVVGPQGTILMATDSISNGWEFYMRKDVFDPQNDPSIRGVISEVFRRRKDVVRSEHPINNLTGWGQRAHALLDNHINSAPYTMDKNSPWYKLVETGGKVVLLGKGFEGNSLLHLTEYIYPEEFPRVVFLKKPVPIRAKGPTGEINTIETVLYTQAWKKGQGTHFCDYLNRKYHIYQAKKFDDYCNITVYNAKDQFEATTKEMKEDVTWYDPQFWPKEPV